MLHYLLAIGGIERKIYDSGANTREIKEKILRGFIHLGKQAVTLRQAEAR